MEKEKILDIYTDESTSDGGRFKSICAVSGLSQNLRELEGKLKSKLVSNKKNNEHPLLFKDLNNTTINLKKMPLNRFSIIELIKECCENKGLSVSLNENNYLKTYDPKTPVNFWHYEPQGDYDKAPIKTKFVYD